MPRFSTGGIHGCCRHIVDAGCGGYRGGPAVPADAGASGDGGAGPCTGFGQVEPVRGGVPAHGRVRRIPGLAVARHPAQPPGDRTGTGSGAGRRPARPGRCRRPGRRCHAAVLSRLGAGGAGGDGPSAAAAGIAAGHLGGMAAHGLGRSHGGIRLHGRGAAAAFRCGGTRNRRRPRRHPPRQAPPPPASMSRPRCARCAPA